MSKPFSLKKTIWIVLLGGGLIASYFAYQRLNPKPSELSEFQETKASLGDLHITILSTGVVTPKNRLDIKPPIPGRVDKLLVDEGDLVTAGQPLAYMSSTERAGLLDSASAKGAKEVKEWESLFKPTPILAPISGTIIKRHVVAGQTFGVGEAVYTMSDRLIVNAQVDETDIGKISLNQDTIINLDAYPKVNVKGKVSKIAFDATTINNVTTYVVEILPEEIPKEMRSGMTANVTFDVETKSQVLLIPNAAVRVDQGRTFVLVPSSKKDEESKEQDIETGMSDGKFIEVLSGLNEGDTLLAPKFSLESDLGNNPFSPFGSRSRKKPSS